MCIRAILANIVRRLESIGLALLLIAFGWECLTQRLEQDKTEGLAIDLHEKIDNLWACIYSEFTQSPANNTTSISMVDMNVINENWEYSDGELRENYKSLNDDNTLLGYIRIVLYVIGSLLVIVAKWNNN